MISQFVSIHDKNRSITLQRALFYIKHNWKFQLPCCWRSPPISIKLEITGIFLLGSIKVFNKNLICLMRSRDVDEARDKNWILHKMRVHQHDLIKWKLPAAHRWIYYSSRIISFQFVIFIYCLCLWEHLWIPVATMRSAMRNGDMMMKKETTKETEMFLCRLSIAVAQGSSSGLSPTWGQDSWASWQTNRKAPLKIPSDLCREATARFWVANVYSFHFSFAREQQIPRWQEE